MQKQTSPIVGGGDERAIIDPVGTKSDVGGDNSDDGDGMVSHNDNDTYLSHDGGLSGLAINFGRFLRKVTLDIFRPVAEFLESGGDSAHDEKEDASVPAATEAPSKVDEKDASTSDLDEDQSAAIDLIVAKNEKDPASSLTSVLVKDQRQRVAIDQNADSTSADGIILRDVTRRELETTTTDNHLLRDHEESLEPAATSSIVQGAINSAFANQQDSCDADLPYLGANAWCYITGFDNGTTCKRPGDIDPVSGPCYELPDCPAWCNSSSYCCNTTVIPGEDVPKYKTEFFVPPVLVDQKGSSRNTIAVREFLQQILPSEEYPKTRVWGYGEYFLCLLHTCEDVCDVSRFIY